MNVGDDKKVYIIFTEDYPLEKVKKELQEECYPYNFYFGRDSAYIRYCEEVWCFGDVTNEADFTLAKELGSSIWVMG